MKIFVIEMNSGNDWAPTVDAATTRKRASELLAEWSSRNPDDNFRVAEYFAVRED